MTTFQAPDAEAMAALGGRLAQFVEPGSRIHIQGDLGAGKTTLVRGFLHASGHTGIVKSPTYTLVESYDLAPAVHHFDLYRLQDPEELEAIGWRDYLDERAICLVEWPERGDRVLTAPDLHLHIGIEGSSRSVSARSHSDRGRILLQQFT